ncbi:MAG TPA: glycosyltransferase family 4 protein [Candidatus Limnocylindrales bacterium]|jgi:hypothetical protein
MTNGTTPIGVGRRGLLLLAMYDLGELDRAPKVRISMMTSALERQIPLERIAGNRTTRAIGCIRWLVGGGWRRIRGAYVESSTSTATPVDLALLALLRLLGRPVGVYFRDAHQTHRDIFPVVRTRQRFADLIWRLTNPLLARIASVRFVPSEGLARTLGLHNAVLLPPGTDPTLPFLGAGPDPLVAAIVEPTRASGFDLLRDAVELVRAGRPGVRLRIVSRVPPTEQLPGWIEPVSGGRDTLPLLLEAARVCVIAVPRSRYTELAIAVKLADFLSLGKPVVATDSLETRRYLGPDGPALLTTDTPPALAEAITRVLDDDVFASDLGRRARTFAEAPANTWDSRASTVLRELGIDVR